MSNFFKREFGPYLRDFNEYDFKFFRTLRDAFMHPIKVIESNDGTFTGELKYVFNLFTLLFILAYALDPSFVDELSSSKFWEFPMDHQKALRLNQQIEESYNGFIMAIAWIPTFFIFLKLFFFRSKPWGFFLSASCYLTPLIFAGIIGLSSLSNIIELPEYLHIPLVSLICLFPLFQLKLQRWYWVVIKLIPALIITSTLTFGIFSPALTNVLFYLLNDSKETIIPKTSDSKNIKDQPINDGHNTYSIYQAEFIDSKTFIYLGVHELGLIVDGKERWLKSFDWSFSDQIKFVPKANVIIHYQETTGKLLLYSLNGDQVFTNGFSCDEKLSIDLIRSSDDAFRLLLTCNQSKELRFKKSGDLWLLQHERNHESYVQHLQHVEGRDQYIGIQAPKKTGHVSTIEVFGLDSSYQTRWRTGIYQKETPYTPHLASLKSVDEENNLLYTSYNLANDTSMVTNLHCINADDGKLVWHNSFSIPTDVYSFFSMHSDSSYLYLSGVGINESMSSIWDKRYIIGLVARIDRASGNLVNYFFTGYDNQNNATSVVLTTLSSRDSLHLVTFDGVENFNLLNSDATGLHLKTVKKKF